MHDLGIGGVQFVGSLNVLKRTQVVFIRHVGSGTVGQESRGVGVNLEGCRERNNVSIVPEIIART